MIKRIAHRDMAFGTSSRVLVRCKRYEHLRRYIVFCDSLCVLIVGRTLLNSFVVLPYKYIQVGAGNTRHASVKQFRVYISVGSVFLHD